MSNPSVVRDEDETFVRRTTEAAIRIALLFVLAMFCINIIRPFLVIILWGLIIAIGVHPIFRRFKSILGNKDKLAAVLITLVMLAILIIPSLMLAGSAIHGVQAVSTQLKDGTLAIPPPAADVAEWPLVGPPVYKLWMLASTNLTAAIQQLGPQIREGAAKVISAAAGVGIGVLQFLLSIMVAGAFLASGEAGRRAAILVFTRVAGDSGEELVNLAGATTRSVVQGVLGVAMIQALASGIGLLLVGVPAAGLWALVVLVLAVVQVPPLLVLGPAAVYVFSTSSTPVAVAFLIWAIIVSMSDAFLKPLLLGRGVEVPMLAILLGAIGGVVFLGIIGLFVGAVVLALGYKLFQAWLVAGKPVQA
jgi:predicted PurR-regulated permease PerM